MELESKIEGLLFYKGEEMSVWKLAQLLEVTPELVDEALLKLEHSFVGRGLTLIRKDEVVMLGIARELSPIIESIRKDEITRDLSKASLETFSIVLYKSGITRSQIDYIRGVNSSFILRNLLIRGLIEKVIDETDNKRALYRPTFDALAYMGITTITDLPNYDQIRTELELAIHQSK